jgi:hypothetical protein
MGIALVIDHHFLKALQVIGNAGPWFAINNSGIVKQEVKGYFLGFGVFVFQLLSAGTLPLGAFRKF